MRAESYRLRIRFISSTPMNVNQGSGTYVGIETLARSLRSLGVNVDIVSPHFQFPIFTARRLLFNQWLRFQPNNDYDATIGFDMDGYTIAGNHKSNNTVHIASIKGVIADEMRFEAGFTNMTMRIQAACEAGHLRRSDFVMATSAYSAGRIRDLYGVTEAPRIVPELIDLQAWADLAKNLDQNNGP